MSRNQVLVRLEWLAVAGVVLAAGAIAQAEDRVLEGAAVVAEVDDMTLLVDADHGLSTDRWIGVQCAPVTDPLRAQLKLAEGQGLLVREVMPDSPAAKAGLQPNDVVVAVNDKPLANHAALVVAVRTAGDDELELKIVRETVEKTISVKPAKRPKNGFSFHLDGPTNDDYRIQLWEAAKDGAGLLGSDGRALQLRRIAPGILMWAAKPLPEDVTVTIKKEGDKPAKIRVEQGDQEWETTGDQFHKLPVEVQGYVTGLAHGITGAKISVAVPQAIERRITKGLDVVQEGRRRGAEFRSRVRRVPDTLERRLNELERQVNELMEGLKAEPDDDHEKEDH